MYVYSFCRYFAAISVVSSVQELRVICIYDYLTLSLGDMSCSLTGQYPDGQQPNWTLAQGIVAQLTVT